jgi:hypothetical protein
MSPVVNERRSNSTTQNTDPVTQEAEKTATQEAGKIPTTILGRRIVSDVKLESSRNSANVVKNKNVVEKTSNVAATNFHLETFDFTSKVRPEALLRSVPEPHPDIEPQKRQRQQSARRLLFIGPKRAPLKRRS